MKIMSLFVMMLLVVSFVPATIADEDDYNDNPSESDLRERSSDDDDDSDDRDEYRYIDSEGNEIRVDDDELRIKYANGTEEDYERDEYRSDADETEYRIENGEYYYREDDSDDRDEYRYIDENGNEIHVKDDEVRITYPDGTEERFKEDEYRLKNDDFEMRMREDEIRMEERRENREEVRERINIRDEETRTRTEARFNNGRGEEMRERARERVEEIREKVREERKNRIEVRERYEDSRERYEERRELVSQNQERLRECDADECEQAREQIRENAKPFLDSSSELIINALNNLAARIEDSDIEDKERVLAMIDERIASIAQVKAEVKDINETSTEDISRVANGLRVAWGEARETAREASTHAVIEKLERVYEQLSNAGDRVENIVGNESETLVEYRSLLDEANENLELAREEYAQSGNMSVANQYARNAHELFKDARDVLRDLVAGVRGSSGSDDDSAEGNETADDSTNETGNFTGNVTGNFTGNVTGNMTGNQTTNETVNETTNETEVSA